MNNLQGQPPYSGQSQPQRNTKLWIILGSIIGVLVLAMGGCLACGALVGLSVLNEEGTTAEGGRRSTNSRSGEKSQRGGGLAASSWKGTLNCDDGDDVPVVMKFADSGNPLYDYQSSSGLREVELTSPGQSFRFVPAGGGVTSIVLDSFSVSSDRITYTMNISHERSGGTLIQSHSVITSEMELSDNTLDVQNTISSNSTASQPGIVVPSESATVCRGKLNRE